MTEHTEQGAKRYTLYPTLEDGTSRVVRESDYDALIEQRDQQAALAENRCNAVTEACARLKQMETERDRLVEALREARVHLRHAVHCRSNQSMVPPQGFNRYPCDCGIDYAREVATAALAKQGAGK